MLGRTFQIMRRRIALRLRQLHVPPIKGAVLALVIGLILPFARRVVADITRDRFRAP